jgi:hypothetical protein
MFFHIPVPPTNQGSEAPKTKLEVNSVGEPLYLMFNDGSLVINEPTLCKEVIETTEASVASVEPTAPSPLGE